MTETTSTAAQRKMARLAAELAKNTRLVAKHRSSKEFYTISRSRVQQVYITYKQLVRGISSFRHLNREVEWLLDNFYIVDGVASDILLSMRKDEFAKLPQVVRGQLMMPRIHMILSDFLKANDNVVERESLKAFIEAYQRRNPLSIRELNAIPAILKTILIMTIEGLMRQSVTLMEEYKVADHWFNEIMKEAEKGQPKFSNITSRLVSRYDIIPVSLGFQLLHRLSNRGAKVRPVIRWLKLNFARQGISIRELSQVEGRERDRGVKLASNIIDSLRWLNQVRWERFVDEVDRVDRILRKDPAGAYGKMDIDSRRRYERSIIVLSDATGIADIEIARSAVRLSQIAATAAGGVHEQHVGYYLVDEGRKILERVLNHKPTILDRLYRAVLYRPALYYIGSIGIFSIALALYVLNAFPELSLFASLLVAFPLLILASDPAIALVNSVLARVLPVRPIPQLDLSSGISAEQRTCVAVPSMLRSPEAIKKILRRLEINFLGNQDRNIFFTLLMDFRDAETETTPSDASLVALIEEGIAALNKKYTSAAEPRFFVLYRKRVWNAREGVFMGWERKRGKLREFNWLVKGNKPTTYVNAGLTFPKPKYILTLDEDTELPRDAARALVGSIDHPLNRPLVDPKTHTVRRGYGIIQPRVAVRLASSMKSDFSRLFSFSVGIDAYSGPVPDVYQDLFGSGIFFGKGIYDIDAVEETMGDRIPDNRVLSHDLLEGNYARTGFASSIQFFEGFPSNYYEYMLRQHRWIRGDWQILSWLGFRGKHFTPADKWKIFDNARRSVVPIAAVALLGLSWLYGGSLAAVSFFVLFVLGAPTLVSTLVDLCVWGRQTAIKAKFLVMGQQLLRGFDQTFARSIFLLHGALSALDAIAITFIRLLVTKRYLLQWSSSYEVSERYKGGVFEFLRGMWLLSVVSSILLGILYATDYLNPFAHAWVGLWLVSPLVAAVVSMERKRIAKYSRGSVRFLRLIAYRSVRYFLDLSNEENNFLIPDHTKEEVATGTALFSRTTTSPTNIGMMFTSLFSAYDFGYAGIEELVERLKASFSSLDRLERYKGHLYNWYDIRSLEPLYPKYVSTVDSGNFIVSLVALKEGLRSVLNEPLMTNKILDGLHDTSVTLIDEAREVVVTSKGSPKVRRIIRRIIREAEIARKRLSGSRRELSVRETEALIDELRLYNSHIKSAMAELTVEVDNPQVSILFAGTERFDSLLTQHRWHVAELLKFYLVATAPIKESAAWKTATSVGDAYREIRALSIEDHSLQELAQGRLSVAMKEIGFREAVEASSLRGGVKEATLRWEETLMEAIAQSEEEARELVAEIEAVMRRVERYIREADFSFLYNEERGMFHIGYNATFDKIDNSFYDFLASEANMSSFVAVMKEDVRQKHWFYLGRKLVRSTGGISALASWGGSLFEYLTSLLFLDAHDESLLGTSARHSILAHMLYGNAHRVPWGMGESAYNIKDAGGHFQYQIFGDPSLGLKRGLSENLVVAPYTSAMALRYFPYLAYRNLRRLVRHGAWGRYGLCDAVDYTATLSSWKPKGIPVKIYYAHHLGFTVAALNNALHADRFRKLFHADPAVAATDALLEETYPLAAPARPVAPTPTQQVPAYLQTEDYREVDARYVPVTSTVPKYNFISNGTYSTTVSNVGTGWSAYGDVFLTRFRSDRGSGPWGTFLYVKDIESGQVWSPAFYPTMTRGKKAKVLFSENKAEFHNSVNGIDSTLQITVPMDANMELRQLTVRNTDRGSRSIEVSSYGEMIMCTPRQDMHHPMFQKLFISSEFIPRYNALLFERRHPLNREKKLYAAHFLVASTKGVTGHVRNREDFLGRHGSLVAPIGLATTQATKDAHPSHSLDPIFCLKKKVTLKQGESATFIFATAAGDTREEVMKNLRSYQRVRQGIRAFAMAGKESARLFQMLTVSPEQARVFQELASGIVSGEYDERVRVLPKAEPPFVHHLWRHGISGDLPVLVARVKDMEDISFVKSVLLFHRYAREKGIAVDVVILNDYPASYIKTFDDEIDLLIRHTAGLLLGQRGKGAIFHLKTTLMDPKDVEVLQYIANAYFESKEGIFEELVMKKEKRSTIPLPEKLTPVRAVVPDRESLGRPSLLFDNGWGGFDPETLEYVMYLARHNKPPVPWANVIANEQFGTTVTESGSTYTWSEDSYDNRLTTWNNDPLLDKTGEAFYLRDEDTGEVWSPTPLPIRTARPYRVRHGRGYSVFEHLRRGLSHELTVFVPRSGRVKISLFSIGNTSDVKKRISFSQYIEPVLGGHRDDTKRYVHVERDGETGTVFARNLHRNHFPTRYLFVDLGDGAEMTGSREEFLGKYGRIETPVALRRVGLSGSDEYGANACIALRKVIDLEPGETKTVVALLGEGLDAADARSLVMRYRQETAAREALSEVRSFWKSQDAITLRSPDPSLNTLFNGWLIYQALSSRIMGKSGYYQPSGAYGFRDQLQDSMAVVWTDPARVRSLILTAAAHQFREGDVTAWWHEHNNFGLRLVHSDHQLWLPYVAFHYATVTGDWKIFDEVIPFLEAPVPDVSHPEWTGVPTVSEESASLFEHCIRAIERNMRFGKHGLPLMGKSDWNDGLSKVGDEGRGESVWEGWFLYAILRQFEGFCTHRGEKDRAAVLSSVAGELAGSLERHAWDGKWYRRAFLDSGAPIGSASNKEFKIDSIAQSWSVISGGASPERAEKAMDSLERYLMPDRTLLRLLTPALTSMQLDIGYLADYPPGVRENGAQYNHAALWGAQAFALSKDGDKAHEVLRYVNPIVRSETKDLAAIYRVEPYVVASDIYSEPSYKGRGGWTWYTGSAGVMYRTILEFLVGIRKEGNKLTIIPSLPRSWPECSVEMKHGASVYVIKVIQDNDKLKEEKIILLDNKTVDGWPIELVDDGAQHTVQVTVGMKEVQEK